MKRSMETTCIQGGWQPKNGEPRILPIYQSTTFKYSTSEQMGRLFDLEENGYFYTRLANPTNDAVADKIRELDPPDRRQTFMRYLISVARAIIWSARQPYTAAHRTCLSLR